MSVSYSGSVENVIGSVIAGPGKPSAGGPVVLTVNSTQATILGTGDVSEQVIIGVNGDLTALEMASARATSITEHLHARTEIYFTHHPSGWDTQGNSITSFVSSYSISESLPTREEPGVYSYSLGKTTPVTGFYPPR